MTGSVERDGTGELVSYLTLRRIVGLLGVSLPLVLALWGFALCHSPILTTSDCEGAGAMFQVTTLDAEKPPRGADGQAARAGRGGG